MSANAALDAANLAALTAPPLLDLPDWVLMPSRWKRRWIRYLLYTAASGYAALFLIRQAVVNNI